MTRDLALAFLLLTFSSLIGLEFGLGGANYPHLFQIPGLPRTEAITLLFEDQFHMQDTTTWLWRLDGAGTSTSGVQNGIANFTLLGTSTDAAYSNSEIYNDTAGSANWYLRKQVHFNLTNTALTNGSRGWGFWNGEISDPYASNMAWFTRAQGNATYANNGFWAVVQGTGNLPTMHNLDLNASLLADWANYTIDWTSTYCAFYINSILVWNATGNLPDVNCRVDVWVDNAVYSDSWAHIYMNVTQQSSLLVDWVRVTEGWVPPARDSSSDGGQPDGENTLAGYSELGLVGIIIITVAAIRRKLGRKSFK